MEYFAFKNKKDFENTHKSLLKKLELLKKKSTNKNERVLLDILIEEVKTHLFEEEY
jgi:hypothetical protein